MSNMQEVPHFCLNIISRWLITMISESNYSFDSKSGGRDRYCSHWYILCDIFLMILIARFGFPDKAVRDVYIEINELVLK